MRKLIPLFIFLANCAYGQSLNLSGSVSYFTMGWGKSYYPMQVKIFNDSYVDSTTIDSLHRFKFGHLKSGSYDIYINALRPQSGLKNILIKGVQITENLELTKIFLEEVMSCGSKTVILGKKREKELYKNGQLESEGKLSHKYLFFVNGKFMVSYYRKEGPWKFYDESGKLTSMSTYSKDEVTESITYYSNGHAKTCGTYTFGRKCGDWTYFRENGDILFSVNLDIPVTVQINARHLKNYLVYMTVKDHAL